MSTKSKATDAVGTDQLMYVGPTMLRPVQLSHRRVYVGGIPGFALALTRSDPELAACFIPLKDAGKALRELEGHPASTAGEITARYRKVAKRYARSKQ